MAKTEMNPIKQTNIKKWQTMYDTYYINYIWKEKQKLNNIDLKKPSEKWRKSFQTLRICRIADGWK